MAETTKEVASKSATEPINQKKSKLKLQQEIMNKVIANKKRCKFWISWNYIKYQNPSFLAKDLTRVTEAKYEQLINNINGGSIDLRNAIIKKGNSWTWKSEKNNQYCWKNLNNKNIKKGKY